MKLSDFHFDLPDELIARFPSEDRAGSRLLHLKQSGECVDLKFSDILDLVTENDCLIFNNTKVMAARIFGKRDSGGAVELLVERVLSEVEFLSQVKSSNKLADGSRLVLGQSEVEVIAREGLFYRLKLIAGAPTVLELMDLEGEMPLPPYIDREAQASDKQRYQTVYAEHQGAVAAPTAGLHFTDELIDKIKAKGTGVGFVTLHVGSGTFTPVRTDNVLEHKMHSEWYQVDPDVVDLIERTRAKGGRVIAVGTTSVRSLETVARSGKPFAGSGETDIYIYPGFEFKCVDVLITNFHLPDSTLILLVSAFAGKHNILTGYQHAIDQGYRFFSYGDAMFLERAAHQQQD